jgi:hypothetical protein
MSRTRPVDQLKSGDILTKMEVCNLFCEKLRISRDTYYRAIRPCLKFRSLGRMMGTIDDKQSRTERMPYDIAVGIINKMMDNRQPDDPDKYKLEEYYVISSTYGI